MEAPAVPDTLAVPSCERVEQDIDIICPSTTLSELVLMTKQINDILQSSSELSMVSWCGMQYDKVLSKVAESHSNDEFLDDQLDDDAIQCFAIHQLRTSTRQKPRPTESHKVEAERMETTVMRINRRRALASVSSLTLQKACADVFLNNMCDKIQAHNGVCETLFERHRGDETPFARCNAKDEIWQDGDLDCITDEPKVPAMGDAPVGNHQLAVPPKQEARISDKVKSVSTALKVY
jgi:hypothetical protein